MTSWISRWGHCALTISRVIFLRIVSYSKDINAGIGLPLASKTIISFKSRFCKTFLIFYHFIMRYCYFYLNSKNVQSWVLKIYHIVWNSRYRLPDAITDIAHHFLSGRKHILLPWPSLITVCVDLARFVSGILFCTYFDSYLTAVPINYINT